MTWKEPAKVKAGLQLEGDKSVPLKSVHIRAKLLDLAAQVCNICQFTWHKLQRGKKHKINVKKLCKKLHQKDSV